MLFRFFRNSGHAGRVKKRLLELGISVTEECVCTKDRRMKSCRQPGNCPNGMYLTVPNEHSFNLYKAALDLRQV